MVARLVKPAVFVCGRSLFSGRAATRAASAPTVTRLEGRSPQRHLNRATSALSPRWKGPF